MRVNCQQQKLKYLGNEKDVPDLDVVLHTVDEDITLAIVSNNYGGESDCVVIYLIVAI